VSKQLSFVAVLFTFALAFGTSVRAQDKPAAAAPPAAKMPTPVKIQVVISRYQGEKKISSVPYTLSITDGGSPGDKVVTGPTFVGRANLRMGTKVPVAMMSPPSVDGKPMKDIPVTSPIQYQDVGTNIDCNVWTIDRDRFRLEITVDDSSVFPDDKDTPAGAKGAPSFRSFRANDSLLLRDGATSQFTAATDKVSGEIVRVDVTLSVVK
jgi:hypothetical protein